jgi:hypothetical protein
MLKKCRISRAMLEEAENDSGENRSEARRWVVAVEVKYKPAEFNADWVECCSCHCDRRLVTPVR